MTAGWWEMRKMMSVCGAVAALGVLAFSSAVRAQETPAPSLPQTPVEWRAAAEADIAYAVAQTRENHPGPHDPLNPSFAENLTKAAAEATRLAGRIDNAAGYRAVIARFNTLIGDGHAGMGASFQSAASNDRWPGFVTVWRGDGLRVYASEPGGPPVGARAVSCDGTPVKTLIERNVFAFNGRIAEAGHWWIYSRGLFVDRRNPFVTPPTRCVFEAPGGSRSTVTLGWKPLDATFEAWRNASYNGDELPVGLSTPRPGLLWVAMPTFQPDEPQRAAYRAMAEDLKTNRAQIDQARAIVLDLRHNQGGSSEWSYNIATALWGEAAVRQRMQRAFAKVEIWWRASPANAAYVAEAAKGMRAEGRIETADEWDKLGSTLAESAAKGDLFYVQKNDEEAQAAVAAVVPEASSIKAPVFVIVPGQCASACLDALDVFTQFDVTLVGAPSSADSTYMEVRAQATPSGLARVILPNKTWVHRPRGAGQIYPVAVEARMLDWSTQNFATLIEGELAKRPR